MRWLVENDDLSLLSGMTEKERKKLHDKGIFTVTQLSYTFRPRRRSKQLRDKRERYRHLRTALTIRQVARYSLWADSIEDERRTWNGFIGILAKIRDPVLIHDGSYETVFLKRMIDRYGVPPAESVVARAVKKSMNLLSVIFSQIYFPTFSNRGRTVCDGRVLTKQSRGQ